MIRRVHMMTQVVENRGLYRFASCRFIRPWGTMVDAPWSARSWDIYTRTRYQAYYCTVMLWTYINMFGAYTATVDGRASLEPMYDNYSIKAGIDREDIRNGGGGGGVLMSCMDAVIPP